MATVTLGNVGKRYGQKPVLDNVSLRIADGEFVSLVGPSGCGKSTLLRMVAGLESIGSGTISIDGRPVNNVAAKDRDIAMVFQNYALYPHMTVRENMSFALETQGRPAGEIRQSVGRAAEILGLSGLLERLPNELSGGQQQRVAMGRAIVRKPKVFLFDEPLSNLDAKLRVQMRAEIKELHETIGTTIIYVTHDQLEAMTMADRIVVLRNGAIEQEGPPLDLYERPATDFVAGFIGSPSMNLLEGYLEDGGSGRRLRLDDNVSLPFEGRGAAGQIRFGVRPEDLAFGNAGLPCRVVLVEPTGPETQVIAETAGGHRFCAIHRGRNAPSRGDTVHLMPEAGRLHLFDVASGRRVN